MNHDTSGMLANQELGEHSYVVSSQVSTATNVAAQEKYRHVRPVPVFSRLLSVLNKGGLAIVGQGLFAGSHFLVNVMLARWLPPQEYGTFALAYACFLLFLWFYAACIYEPLLVFGSGKHLGQFHGYLRAVMRGNLILVAALTLIIFSGSFVLRHFYPSDVWHTFTALALAAPFVLTTWLGRAGFYARVKPGKAAIGGLIYCCVLTAFLFGARASGRLSPSVAFLGMGLAGLLTNCFFLFLLRATRLPDEITPSLRAVVADHWQYGRWAIAYSAAAWFPDNIYYTVLPAHAGLEGTAALRALVNLINPILHTLIALAAVLIPILVRRFQEGGIRQMNRTMELMLAALIPCSVLYLGLLWMSRTVIFSILYSGKYQQYSHWPLLLVGLLPVTVSAVMVLSAGLRALEKPDAVFWCYLGATVTSLVLGIPLTIEEGVVGAAAGMLISSAVAAFCMGWFFYRSVSAKCAAYAPAA